MGNAALGPLHPSLPGLWGMLSVGLVLLWDAGDTEPILACFCLTARRRPENTKPHRQRPENQDFPIAFALELHMGA